MQIHNILIKTEKSTENPFGIDVSESVDTIVFLRQEQKINELGEEIYQDKTIVRKLSNYSPEIQAKALDLFSELMLIHAAD